MSISVDRNFMLDCFTDLINAPSPCGYADDIALVIEKYAQMFNQKVYFDNKQTAYIEILGEDNLKTVMIGAHIDTLGLVVKKIDKDGMLRVRSVSTLNLTAFEGDTVTVHTLDGRKYTGLFACQSHSVHVFEDALTLKRTDDNMLIRLDENVNSKDDVLNLGISVGDIISFDPYFEYTQDGYLKSHFNDDKACVTSVFGMLKYLSDNKLKPKYRTLLQFSMLEELGLGGSYVPKEVEEFVAVDIALLGPDNVGNEFSVSVCTKDFHTPYDRGLTLKLIEKAKAASCDYAVDICYRYATDASGAVRSGNNVYTAAVGMGCYCSHGRERTNIKGIENTTKLLIAYALDI